MSLPRLRLSASFRNANLTVQPVVQDNGFWKYRPSNKCYVSQCVSAYTGGTEAAEVSQMTS